MPNVNLKYHIGDLLSIVEDFKDLRETGVIDNILCLEAAEKFPHEVFLSAAGRGLVMTASIGFEADPKLRVNRFSPGYDFTHSQGLSLLRKLGASKDVLEVMKDPTIRTTTTFMSNRGEERRGGTLQTVSDEHLHEEVSRSACAYSLKRHGLTYRVHAEVSNRDHHPTRKKAGIIIKAETDLQSVLKILRTAMEDIGFQVLPGSYEKKSEGPNTHEPTLVVRFHREDEGWVDTLSLLLKKYKIESACFWDATLSKLSLDFVHPVERRVLRVMIDLLPKQLGLIEARGDGTGLYRASWFPETNASFRHQLEALEAPESVLAWFSEDVSLISHGDYTTNRDDILNAWRGKPSTRGHAHLSFKSNIEGIEFKTKIKLREKSDGYAVKPYRYSIFCNIEYDLSGYPPKILKRLGDSGYVVVKGSFR